MAWEEVIYQYDGSFDGFLCCVFDSYTHKEFPTAFYGDEECCVLSFYPVRTVITDTAHARRVYLSLCKRSERAAEMIRRAFLTCMEEKECRLYALIRKLYREGPGFLRSRSDEVVYPVAAALRHMSGELEKLRGFVRFSQYGGNVLGAEIEPKNRVLPLLRSHFCNRYANESFFIYDRTHREVLLYAKGKSRILPVEGLELSLPDEEELHYRTLWKRFYETIAIKERENPRCQNTFLPKRYRGVMTEFLPVDYEARRGATAAAPSAALPDTGVPSAIPAPEIRPECGPSAPASSP